MKHDQNTLMQKACHASHPTIHKKDATDRRDFEVQNLLLNLLH